MITIECQTLFDITATGVTGHFKSSRVPFKDNSGNEVVDEITWNRARNQQRNWETLTQIVGLRAQLNSITEPSKIFGGWVFKFTTDIPDAFGTSDDPTAILKYDAHSVPMLNNLDNEQPLDPFLITHGEGQNIWFTTKQ